MSELRHRLDSAVRSFVDFRTVTDWEGLLNELEALFLAYPSNGLTPMEKKRAEAMKNLQGHLNKMGKFGCDSRTGEADARSAGNDTALIAGTDANRTLCGPCGPLWSVSDTYLERR